MVGRDVFLEVKKPPVSRGKKVLEVKQLSYISETGRPMLRDMSFNVYAGEILGVAGVEGNGQTELVEVLSGLRPAATGEVLINGKNVVNQSPRNVRQTGELISRKIALPMALR